MTKQGKVVLISVIATGLVAISLIFAFVIIISTNSSDNTFDIKSIEIQTNGRNVGDGIDKEFNDDDFVFSVVINNNEDNDKDKPKIDWSIIDENNLNCTIDSEGKFTIGDTLGALKVRVSVTSKNTLTATADVTIIVSNEFNLHSIEAVIPQGGLHFIEGQTFDQNRPKVAATFLSVGQVPAQVYVSDYDYDVKDKLVPSNTRIQVSYAHKGIERIADVDIAVNPKTLKSIEITKAPAKTNYVEGEKFNDTGLEVTAHYEYIHEIVNNYTVEVVNGYITDDDEVLLSPTSVILITYAADGAVKTTTQPLTVARRTLQSIQIVSQPAKLNYIQGQTFRTEGLKVLARYEYFDRDVTEQVIIGNSDKLFHADDKIIISYTENGRTESKQIAITVVRPYDEIRKIVFENPFDATLSWIYRYTTDEGESVIHNTEVEKYDNLLFDNISGTYIAPVGAIITIMRVNPVIIDFVINEQPFGLLYPENSIEFEFESGDDMTIEFTKLVGDRITVRFLGIEGEQNWVFIYPLNWNEPLKVSDLSQIAQIYEDTENYYYEYTIDANTYTFSELSAVNITADTLVIVKKIERADTQIVTITIAYDGVRMTVALLKTDEQGLFLLPQIKKTGYSLGFSLQEDGALLNDETFAEWLKSANDGNSLYAVYTLIAIEQSGEIIGLWRAEITEEGGDGILIITIVFDTDGTYVYEVLSNGETNCKFTGIYRFEGNVVNILSAESDDQYQLVSAADFDITLENGTLNATLFITDGLRVGIGQIDLIKGFNY